MLAWIRRHAFSVLADLSVVCALGLPSLAGYLRWPLAAAYVWLSALVVTQLYANRWIFWIVRAPATRVAHGLEHATIAVLEQNERAVIHGFTHAPNRFMVALNGDARGQEQAVTEAATRAIARLRAGEHALAYQPGCGTSKVVVAASLWVAYLATAIICLLAGGSTPMWFALCVIAFRIWQAWETPLGLLAQRLFTVSTAFQSARVIFVEQRATVAGFASPANEVWYEVAVEVERATRGGLVTPGALA